MTIGDLAVARAHAFLSQRLPQDAPKYITGGVSALSLTIHGTRPAGTLEDGRRCPRAGRDYELRVELDDARRRPAPCGSAVRRWQETAMTVKG